ncbi:hypothetical protein [Magnetospirillum fulvum]|uniref:Uncharacterized protein n=1 Tax=Magnetospirillum fulvum MGU-K5 TaxID=1316936 RepID=S9S720_MAGFU|nr:hypothetical protein [Magnetospirillum fulvum]EPY01627.1 hypothetical protein K678_09943 [Magnetospirillum fulvum MGU-K5]
MSNHTDLPAAAFINIPTVTKAHEAFEVAYILEAYGKVSAAIRHLSVSLHVDDEDERREHILMDLLLNLSFITDDEEHMNSLLSLIPTMITNATSDNATAALDCIRDRVFDLMVASERLQAAFQVPPVKA